MEGWRTCSSCKKEIAYNSPYYECSVSTCSGKRTGYVFCSIPCFERHLPGARHRDAGAVERKAPSSKAKDFEASSPHSPAAAASNSTPTRRIISNPSPTTSSTASLSEEEILIVVSKMKNYIREKSEMNTSGDVAEVLSHFVRRLCDQAILNARQDGRKTVMGRDFNP